MLKILIFLCVLKFVFAEKCSYIFDDKNVFKYVECKNLNSMNDIASEVRGNWTAVKVINGVSHAGFSNIAGEFNWNKVLSVANVTNVKCLM